MARVPRSAPTPGAFPGPETAAATVSSQTGRRLPAMLRALRHRNYRLFFVGQLISLIGTWMQSVAMGWLVYRLTGSEGLLGLVAASTSLPVLIFSLSGGALADQVPKKRVLLTTQSTAMLLALTIALLTFTNVVQVWHIIVLAMLQGMVNAFDAPARQAFAIEMVGREDLLNAIALNSSLFNIARTAGPALAGVIVALVGEAPAFLFNGLSFLAIIICLLLMRLPPFEPPQRSRQRDQLRESLGYIVQEPTVRTLLLIAGSISLFGLAYFPLLPAFARDVLQTDARGFGLLSASSGAGALVAALSLAQFSDHMSRGRLLIGALLLFPLFLVGFTLMRSLLPAMLMITLVGWSGVTSLALTNTLIQSIVPDALRARVMSVFTMQLMGLGPFGALGAGVVAQWVGSVPLVMACCAAIAWFIVLGNVVLVPRLWQL